MKLFLAIFLLLNSYSVIAQNDTGAIKTKNGVLLYFNSELNSHTVHLEGDIDLSYYPFIKLNNNGIQFNSANKVQFGTNSKTTLTNYMNWEINHLKKIYETNIKFKNEPLVRNGLNMNFWKYTNPEIYDENSYTPVKATYFLDFIKNERIYRVCYSSLSGNDSEAKDLLYKITDSYRFYTNRIDLIKLRNHILQGKYDY